MQLVTILVVFPVFSAATALAHDPGTVHLGGDVTVTEGQVVDEIVTFGGDVEVLGEVKGAVTTMGGDARILGPVGGDVVTMGGDALVRAEVGGDVATLGGDLRLEDGGVIRGDMLTAGGHVETNGSVRAGGDQVQIEPGWLGLGGFGTDLLFAGGGLASDIISAVTGVLSYAFLFVLGLVLMGLLSERFEAIQVALVREPVRAGLLGLVSVGVGTITVLLLSLTILGIPAAVVIVCLATCAAYVGLAATAVVLGAALPVTRLRGRPVLQLLSGVTLLFAVSFVPVVGTFFTLLAVLVGLGALILSHSHRSHAERPVHPAGPYRTESP